MTGKLSARTQVRLAALAELAQKVQRAYGLVEQFAAARSGHDLLVVTIQRSFSQLKRDFLGAGFDALSQLAGAMEIAARRGSNPHAKARILREGVGSMRFQIELEQRVTLAEDPSMKEEAEPETEA